MTRKFFRSSDDAVSDVVEPEPSPLEPATEPEPAPAEEPAPAPVIPMESNLAAAQIPAHTPDELAPERAEEARLRREALRDPKSDRDRLDALIQWGRELRLRGNVTSGDWEEFTRLSGAASR